MAYLTDRKRAEGHGSSKTGTEHFWAMKKSSVALLILVPLFVWTFSCALGASYEEVQAYYARPFPALVAALMILVGFHHFNLGVQVVIEDYMHGLSAKVAILLLTYLSYGAAAVGIFAIAKLAL